jgi:hypothetical protein
MQPVFKYNGNVIFTAFCGGALTMMIIMCACMLFTATLAPSALPLTIISAAIFGPAILGASAGATVMKLAAPKQLLLLATPVENASTPSGESATEPPVGNMVSNHEE